MVDRSHQGFFCFVGRKKIIKKNAETPVFFLVGGKNKIKADFGHLCISKKTLKPQFFFLVGGKNKIKADLSIFSSSAGSSTVEYSECALGLKNVRLQFSFWAPLHLIFMGVSNWLPNNDT